MENNSVLERCKEFLLCMKDITPREHIGVDIFARTPATEWLHSLSNKVAKGNAYNSPVTLTVGCGKIPSFDLRGTHAYGVIATENATNWGALAIIVLSVCLLLTAIALFRSN